MAVPEIASLPSEPPLERQQLNLPLLEEAEAAYRRNLPTLLAQWPEYWVAYHGKERLGISYYAKRLRKRFALPPEGRLSWRERWFGQERRRFPRQDISLYFIDTTILQDDFEITSEPCY